MNSHRESMLSPDDDVFLRAFDSGQIANQRFHHRDHLRLAWLEIRQRGLDRASDAVSGGIRHFAERHGNLDRYNETLTRFWLRVVDIASRRHPDLDFDALLAAEPHLLDKTLPFRHWSPESLTASETKAKWVEPDLQPIPPI